MISDITSDKLYHSPLDYGLWSYFRNRIWLEHTGYGYILQLLQMKKKIVVLIGSLQAEIASFIGALTTV